MLRSMFLFVLVVLFPPLTLSAQDFRANESFANYYFGDIDRYSAVVAEVESDGDVLFRSVHLTPKQGGSYISGFDKDGDGWNFIYVCRQDEGFCVEFRLTADGQVLTRSLEETFPAEDDELADALEGIRNLDTAVARVLFNQDLATLP